MSLDSVNKALKSIWPEWYVTREIGEGSYGTVYRAFSDSSTGRMSSAVKVITIPRSQTEVASFLAEGHTTADARDYFFQIVENCKEEIQIMEQLKDSPNIVRIQASHIVPHQNEIAWDIYIRMELLTPFIDYQHQKQPFPQDEAIELGIDLCKALIACEKYNTIHRDIKPQNIFVSEDNTFKLGDFGVAKTLENISSALSQKGSVNYMAPEMYHGSPYDQTVDIYSLGLVLYWLMNKTRMPFLDTEKQMVTLRERSAALEKRLNGEEIPAPLNAGTALSAAINKAIRYAPEDRYQNAGQMLSSLLNARLAISKGPEAEERYAEKLARIPLLKRTLLKKNLLAAGIALAIAACSYPAVQYGISNIRSNSKETVASDVQVPDFNESGLTDHVMVWNDENLEKTIRNITEISNGDIFLSDIWPLTSLDLSDSNIHDISALSELTNLTWLNLNNNDLRDVSSLSDLKSLESLYMNNNYVSDISFLSNLSGLSHLELSGNRITDISLIGSLGSLADLSVGNNPLTSPNPIHELSELKILDVNNTGISDLQFLDGLSLEECYIGENDISDITVLKQMPSLMRLDLQDTQITDLMPLSASSELVWLDLENCSLSDIRVLTDKKKLRYLDLSGNQLTDLSPLSDLTELSWLDLNSNRLSGNLDALKGLSDMIYLDIRNNSISDISSLFNMTSLRYLYISNNPVKDISVTETLNLEELG